MIFSDNIPLLKHCAKLLRKPFIYGKTGDQERKYWLHNFNHTQSTNCLFISSVGDTSIDLPDVNVVIQISSHYGSRDRKHRDWVIYGQNQDKVMSLMRFFILG